MSDEWKAERMDMAPCPYENRLDRYHDGEMDEPSRSAMVHHLSECAQCRGAMVELQRLSELFRGTDAVQMTPMQRERLRSRVRAAIDSEADPRLTRMLRFWAAAAASVLIVSAAWLAETPHPTTPRQALAPAPAWERMAMTLQPDLSPTPELGEPTRLADAHLADFILDSLTEK